MIVHRHPNLQNIPIRTEEGRRVLRALTQCYLCGRRRGLSGNKFWCLDCCQERGAEGIEGYRRWLRENNLIDCWAGVS